MTYLQLGSKYLFQLPNQEGAISDFLRESGNTLLIAMADIDDAEADAMRRGKLKCGILSKNGAIIFVWEFFKNKNPVITLDSFFDARAVPDLHLHDIENPDQQHLVIDIHIVDSGSRLIKGLRSVTMPPGLTIEFLSAVQYQLSTNTDNGIEQLDYWMQKQPSQLSKMTTMWTMGE